MAGLHEVADFSLRMGWCGMLFGVVSGAVVGLFFHRPDWLGGYGSFARRLVRLGHIAFFGLGFVNLFFALSVERARLPLPFAWSAAWLFAAGLALMSTVCFLTAWKTRFRHAFPFPVTAVGGGILLLLIGWGKG